MSALEKLQERAFPLIALLELYLHLLVDLFEALVVFIQSIELVDKFLVVIEAEELFHLFDLCDLCLLSRDLLLHLLHDALVTCELALGITLCVLWLRLVVDNSFVRVVCWEQS